MIPWDRPFGTGTNGRCGHKDWRSICADGSRLGNEDTAGYVTPGTSLSVPRTEFGTKAFARTVTDPIFFVVLLVVVVVVVVVVVAILELVGIGVEEVSF